jgi:hypothetical protein
MRENRKVRAALDPLPSHVLISDHMHSPSPQELPADRRGEWESPTPQPHLLLRPAGLAARLERRLGLRPGAIGLPAGGRERLAGRR